MDWQALLLTFRLAAVTAVILLGLAVPVAAWLTLSRSRWRRLVHGVVRLPLVLPSTVIGFYLLVFLGSESGFGHILELIFGHPVVFSFSGLVMGSVVYGFPFAVEPLAAGFAGVDRDVADAARLLGARGWRLLTTILLPLSWRSLGMAAVLSFLHTMGEFGVVLMLGGDIPGATRTLPVVLFHQTQSFSYAKAQGTALVLVVVSFALLLGVYLWPKGERDRWRGPLRHG